MSTNTGFAPTRAIAPAVAKNVYGVVMTSSPSPMPSAIRQARSASVPEDMPTPCAQVEYCAIALSHSSTFGPRMKCCDSITSAIAASISALIDKYCAFRSSNGTFMLRFLLDRGDAGVGTCLRLVVRTTAGNTADPAGRAPGLVGVVELKTDQLTPRVQRRLSGFEEIDDRQTSDAIVDRGAIVPDAVDEVIELDLQRLGLFNPRRPHVARAVADQQVVYVVAVRDLHALVVDLDLLVCLEVVPDQHLVATADQRGSHFHRRQPVDVDVRD